ncbi:putative membrane protein [Pseudomonas aeruginosa]|nr:hypothetical protein Q080_02224 [Pseudomonas aeruginosa M8A.1]PRW04482.1 putative membrane protein [Pseudomonas aeruginosa]
MSPLGIGVLSVTAFAIVMGVAALVADHYIQRHKARNRK